jgi:hypothetical protein
VRCGAASRRPLEVNRTHHGHRRPVANDKAAQDGGPRSMGPSGMHPLHAMLVDRGAQPGRKRSPVGTVPANRGSVLPEWRKLVMTANHRSVERRFRRSTGSGRSKDHSHHDSDCRYRNRKLHDPALPGVSPSFGVDGGQSCLHQQGWKAVKVGEGWEHICPDCRRERGA